METIKRTVVFQAENPPPIGKFDLVVLVFCAFLIFSGAKFGGVAILLGYAVLAILYFHPIRVARWATRRTQGEWLEQFKKITNVSDRINVSPNRTKDGLIPDGIAYRDKTIFLMQAGELFEIPWSLVRRWRTEMGAFGQLQVFGLGTGAAAARLEARLENLQAAAVARNASGLFLEIADEHNPELQFKTRDSAVLKRWFEILNQVHEDRI